MIYCEIIIRKKRVISPKSNFCIVDADDAFCIPAKCNSSKPLCGYGLPCGVPIQVYGVPKTIKGKKVFSIYFFAYIGTVQESARAAGISKQSIEKWGDRIASDAFLCDLSIPRSDRLKALALEHPIDLINGFEQALSLEFSDQSDIYADKKRRQVLKASDYYCPREIVRPADLLERNPFLMAVPAVGFTYSECAQIATYLGNRAAFESIERVAGLIRRQLLLEEKKGHSWTDGIKLVRSAYNFAIKEGFPVKKKTFYHLLSDKKMCKRQGIVVVEEQSEGAKYPVRCVFTEEAYKAEEDVAKQIHRLLQSSAALLPDRKVERNIKKEERKLGFKLAPAQKAAIKTTMQNNFCVVTGGPGTGKSTIIKGICEIYKHNFPKKSIQLLAPTGKAAQRMSECVDGLDIPPATTIHKALNLVPGQRFSGMVLDADMVIVDESSMIDIQLASSLLESIQDDGKCIFVGDPNQLPSIGCGAFLENLIESGVIPVAKLEGVFRQKTDSSVAINAARIRNNLIKPIEDDNFRFYEHANILDSQAEIVSLYKQLVCDKGMKMSDVCVLTPRRRNSPTGSETLNLLIQEAINPAENGKPEVSISGKVFRLHDRIMMTRNIENVTNGDTGEINNIVVGETTTIMVKLDDDRVLSFDPESDLAKSMVLGYAMTVHKSQGSEYKTIIMTVQKSHLAVTAGPKSRGGVKRNLVYTAITRAKKQVFVVGQKAAFIKACEMVEAHTRRTGLVRQLIFLGRKK